jgi:hypothetical protein
LMRGLHLEKAGGDPNTSRGLKTARRGRRHHAGWRGGRQRSMNSGELERAEQSTRA